MIRIKLGLLTLLALVVSSVTLAAVAQSASTVQTVRVSEVSYGIRFSAKPKAGTVKFQVRNASGDAHDFLAQGRRQDLEDPRPRRQPDRQPHRQAQERRPLLLLVLGQRSPAGRDVGQLRRPLAPPKRVEASPTGGAFARPKPLRRALSAR